jgi:hypothetical protein
MLNMAKESKVALIPPDLKRCQAIKQSGSFMSFGKPTQKRCQFKAKFIATEVKPREKDGVCGSMSLCDTCAKHMQEQLGTGYATLVEIPTVAACMVVDAGAVARVLADKYWNDYEDTRCVPLEDIDPATRYRLREACHVPKDMHLDYLIAHGKG